MVFADVLKFTKFKNLIKIITTVICLMCVQFFCAKYFCIKISLHDLALLTALLEYINLFHVGNFHLIAAYEIYFTTKKARCRAQQSTL